MVELEVHLVSLGYFVEERVLPPSGAPLLDLVVFFVFHLVEVFLLVIDLNPSQLLRFHSAENFRCDDQNVKGFLVLEHESFVDDFAALLDGLDFPEADVEDDLFLVENEHVRIRVFR